MANDIALIIGNGFSLSFNKHHNFEKYNDTQNPTKWPLTFGIEGKPLIESFPQFKNFLCSFGAESDFIAFEKAAEVYKERDSSLEYFKRIETEEGFNYELTEAFKRDIIPIECRHFLCLAFAQYSIDARAIMNNQWPWFKWLNNNRSRISTICSFNYDLIIESILTKVGRSYFNEAMTTRFGAVPLYKPHGSCDYESYDIVMRAQYPLQSYFDDNDFRIRKLNTEELLLPRTVPYCVIPNQENIHAHFQAMLKQESIFYKNISTVDYCIIIGHSYADVDKPEIDVALSKLKNNAKVIVANPTPSKELLQKIAGLGLESICWTNYLGPVNDNGEILKL